MHVHAEPGTEHVEQGIDLTEYYINVEWDILKVPAERHVKVKQTIFGPGRLNQMTP